jgi:hypothetical protein
MQVRMSEFVKNEKLTIRALQDVDICKIKIKSTKDIKYNKLLELSKVNERVLEQWLNIFLATNKIEISGEKHSTQEILTEKKEEVNIEKKEIV